MGISFLPLLESGDSMIKVLHVWICEGCDPLEDHRQREASWALCGLFYKCLCHIPNAKSFMPQSPSTITSTIPEQQRDNFSSSNWCLCRLLWAVSIYRGSCVRLGVPGCLYGALSVGHTDLFNSVNLPMLPLSTVMEGGRHPCLDAQRSLKFYGYGLERWLHS